jgi:hypothetical protein
LSFGTVLRRPRNLAIVALATLGTCLAYGGEAAATDRVTELLSTGPAGGNGAQNATFRYSSADGSHVLFDSSEQLVPGDTDSSVDTYERAGGTTTLVSTGPAGGNGAFDAYGAGISEDGAHAFIGTQEQLVAEDTDDQYDLYDRSGGTTTLVTTGPAGGNGPYFVYSEQSSADGAHVFFSTNEQLVAADTDSYQDVYERFAGTTTLISIGPAGGNGPFEAGLDAVSADGSRVIFGTKEQLTSGDTDSEGDLYARSAGTTQLLSTGPGGSMETSPVAFGGASRDATTVAFETNAFCYPPGYDCHAVWVNSGGTTSNVTGPGGEYGGISKDGQHVFYTTDNMDAPGSGDYCGTYQDEYDFGCPDLFDYSGGTKRTVSAGGPYQCADYYFCSYGTGFGGASADGSHVFFMTNEQLTAEDEEQCMNDFDFGVCTDVYENTAAGGTVLVSKHSSPGAYDNLGSAYLGNSDDGSRVFYGTARSSAPGDSDTRFDIFERYANTTTLVSTGPAGGNGAFSPTFKDVSDDGSRVFFETNETLTYADLDSSTDVYESRLADTGGYIRPKAASPVRISLVPAAKVCTAPNRVHGPPLAFNSCSPVVSQSPNLTIGIGDGNPAGAKSTAFVRLESVVGAPGGPDDSDVDMRFTVTNVMKLSDLSDYAGELRGVLTLRLTDKSPASTTADFPFGVTVPCTPTADTTLGATCGLATTADTVIPGSVPEGQRSVWGVDQAKVYDGGADGDADTAGDNSLFEVQGVFVP